MPSNHLILCRPLLLPPSIFPNIRVFSNESALPIRWPKYWSFSFSISPSNEYSGLISFRIYWFDLLAVQHYSSKFFSNTIVQKHQFFCAQLSLVQFSHPYMTTGKTIALTRWTFVGKLTSLLFNMLSQLVITFLPRVFYNTIVQKHQFFGAQLSLVQFSHPYMTTRKTIALTRWTLVGKVMSLVLNMLSRLVITFLPRSKHLLISSIRKEVFQMQI